MPNTLETLRNMSPDAVLLLMKHYSGGWDLWMPDDPKLVDVIAELISSTKATDRDEIISAPMANRLLTEFHRQILT